MEALAKLTFTRFLFVHWRPHRAPAFSEQVLSSPSVFNLETMYKTVKNRNETVMLVMHIFERTCIHCCELVVIASVVLVILLLYCLLHDMLFSSITVYSRYGLYRFW